MPTDIDNLLIAALNSNIPDYLMMFIQDRSNLTRPIIHNHFLIEVAARMCKWQHVETIAKHIKTDEKDSLKFGAALLWAVSHDQVETVNILLAAGAPLYFEYINTGNTCLHKAVENNNPQMINILLRAGIQHTINKIGQTPIELAAALNHWDCVIAIERKIQFDSQKLTRIFASAVASNQLNVAKILFNSGASITGGIFSEKHGTLSCLRWAILNKNPEMIRFLINRGAQLSTVEKGKTIYEFAIEVSAHEHLTQACNLYLLDFTFISTVIMFAQGKKQDQQLFSLPHHILNRILSYIAQSHENYDYMSTINNRIEKVEKLRHIEKLEKLQDFLKKIGDFIHDFDQNIPNKSSFWNKSTNRDVSAQKFIAQLKEYHNTNNINEIKNLLKEFVLTNPNNSVTTLLKQHNLFNVEQNVESIELASSKPS
jgi:ankyrin repeat protein